MTFGLFVETKFIPEHVEHKTLSGQTHYQAILKHLLRPETVNRIFNPKRIANARLKSVPGWPYLDDLRLCDISAGHVRQLISAAFARQYSSQTVKHIKNVAFAIISHAQREGCFQGPNPVSQVNLPPMTRKTEQHLSVSQTRAILEVMSYPEREIALITIATGMNIQEICNLQWKHVNLSSNPRQVDGELIPAMSIAVRTRWNRIGLGDSKRGRKRNIGIPKPLISILESLQLRKGQLLPDDFVLESQDGHPIPPAGIRAGRLKPIGRKVGAPWLSWRVLGRAQVGALSGFRSRLTFRTELVVQQRPGATAPLSGDADSDRSGTIDPQAPVQQMSLRPQVVEK
jgi:integrase